MTTFVSFNINGIRARIHQLQMIKNTLDADIIGLQEIKVQDKDFPSSLVQNLGYHLFWAKIPLWRGYFIQNFTYFRPKRVFKRL